MLSIRDKLHSLDGLRGWAAIVVFFHHFLLAFLPKIHGLLPTDVKTDSLRETPLFVFVNGTAAVTLFFVLSGFVLSLGLWENKDKIIFSALKRWPRLILLPTISVLFVCVLANLNLFYFKEAATISQSAWMNAFGFSSNGGVLNKEFGYALSQGTFFTFFRGDQSLNSSLWTMSIEFMGSLLVFAFVAICGRQRLRLAVSFAAIINLILFYHGGYYYSAFIFGAIISKAYIDGYFNHQVSPFFIFFLGAISLLFLGYIEPGRGFYAFMDSHTQNYLRIYIHIICSSMILYCCINSSVVSFLMSCRLSRFLGRVSFPLYVIHVPVLFSFSAYLFVYLSGNDYQHRFITLIGLSLFTCLTIASLLARGDEAWCRWVDKCARFIGG